MRVPSWPNKRFIVFSGNSFEFLGQGNFATFEEAWSNVELQMARLVSSNGMKYEMLHESAKLCYDANPTGDGGNSYMRTWKVGVNTSENPDTRRICGGFTIIEIQWSPTEYFDNISADVKPKCSMTPPPCSSTGDEGEPKRAKTE